LPTGEPIFAISPHSHGVTALHRSQPPLHLVSTGEAGGRLDDVYRRYCPYVARVVLRLAGRQMDVDDIVQDVFVEATRGIRGLRDPEAVKGWLAKITVRVVRRRLHVRRLRRFLGLDAAPDYAALADTAASPVDRLLVRAVYRVLDELPVADRLAFSLHHIEGEKLDAVARLCGCSCATAKRRIARAQRAIEEKMGDG
jgi:RNA polymerase sigma-70 factor, ECF subfamily